MSKRQSFTPATIDGLMSGKLADPATIGLSIVASGTGAKLRRTWRYQRRISGTNTIHNATGGRFPAVSIGEARAWAETLNQQCEGGTDPNAKARVVTVDDAHAKYMEAVHEGTHRTRKTVSEKPQKPGTAATKLALYNTNVKKVLGQKAVAEVTESHLDAIIQAMTNGEGRRKSPIQANRLGVELRVFFGWVSSRRGRAVLGVDVTTNPADRIGELWNPQRSRDRWLDHEELPLFLRSLAQETEKEYRRGLLLILLTGARKSEIFEAPSSEIHDGIWEIPAERTKNGHVHTIALGPWGRVLVQSGEKYIIPSRRLPHEPFYDGWSKILLRLRLRMEKIGEREVAHFTLHDLRRTMRSHVEDHGIDDVMGERMINHLLPGLKKIYNRNKRGAAMADGFGLWDAALNEMARRAGVADALEVPVKSSVETATPSGA